jgi:hypothetical protein
MKKLSSIFIIAIAFLFSSCAKKDIAVKTAATGLPENLNVASPYVLANDPFTPYLSSIPMVISTISTTNSGSGSSAITTKRFTFSSKGGVNTVYAIISYPQAAGTYPAILFSHGGGSDAEGQLANVQTYSAMGYVTMSIDIPAIAGTGNTPNSSGPWKSDPAGDSSKFDVSGGIQNCRLVDAGVASLQAFNYLKSQANVKPASIGLAGSSWGGYMATFLAGLLGSEVKTVYSSFGCGFYDLGSAWTSTLNGMSATDRATWETYFDAGRRAPGITAPYFLEEPSDDTYFWPEAVAGTLSAIPGTKNHVCMPNLNHQWIPAATAMKQLYMAYYLKGTGSPFGSVNVLSSLPQSDGSLQVNMNVSVASGTSVSSVQLYYSVPTANWQTRNWIAINATLVSGTTYRATLSSSLVSQKVNYFGQFVDSRTITTSTAMYQTSAGQTISNGTYKIINRNSGLALDVKGKLTANSTAVDQWTYTGSTNQQWMVTSLGGGQYEITGIQSGRALDVNGQLTADGTAIDIYDYKASANQKWTITATSGGYYAVVGVQSGKPMEVAGNSTTAGALVDIFTNHSGNNQQWIFQAPW